MTRRILQIIPSLEPCGAADQLALLTGRLAREEFDVHVCALREPETLAAAIRETGVPVTVLHKRPQPAALTFWRLQKQIRKLRPDLVHTWTAQANRIGRAAALAAGCGSILVSVREIDRWKSWQQVAGDRYLAARSRAMIVNSRGLQERLLEEGVPENKLRLIHDGVEVKESGSITRVELLAELGLPGDARLVLTVGRLHPRERIKDLIWAADLLKVIRDDVHLFIVGDGPQRQILERYRRQCRIEDKVHFLGIRDDLSRMLPHFEVFWRASDRSGLANSILQAMAAGVPVVASDIWGHRELVAHGQTGYLAPIGDRAGFARHAHRILDDHPLAQRLGAAAKARAATEFTPRAMAEQHVALYREVLSR